MRTISILGCGWLGLPLAEWLLEKGWRVKGSTTRPEKLSVLKERGIEAYRVAVGEELEGEDLSEFFRSPALLINIPPGGRRDPEAARRYPDKIKHIIEAARRGDVRRVLFVSSTGVYGQATSIITEADTPRPRTASGKALAQTEAWLLDQQDLDITILRLSGLVGGERKPGRFLAGKTGLSNGSAPVNLIHRDDCIRIIYEILRQEIWGEIFNAAADGHPSRRDFYIYQAKKEGLIPPEFLPDTGEETGKVISNEKVKAALGYRFLHPDPMQF